MSISQRNQLETMLAEIRKVIRRHELHMVKMERDNAAYPGSKLHDKHVESLARQRAIEAYLQGDFTALVTGSPLAAARQSLTPPATIHHGPEY